MPKPPVPAAESEPTLLLRRRSMLAGGACAVVMLSLTWLLWHLSTQFLTIRLQKASEQNSTQAVVQLESFLDDRMVALRRLAQFCASSENLLEPEFSAFTNAVLADVPGILGVLRTDGKGVPVWQVPAGVLQGQDEYLLTGDPQLQQTLHSAAGDNQAHVTDAMQIPGHGGGFLAALPLSRSGRNEGFIIGVFDYQDLLNDLIDPELLKHYHIGIAQAGRVIFPPLGGADIGIDSMMNRLGKSAPPFQIQRSTDFGGQEWEIMVEPIEPPATTQSIASLSIIALGLTLTIVLSLLAFRWVLRTGQLQAEARVSRKRLEATGVSLVEIKAELDLILNSVDEGIVLYDANLKPIQANTPFLTMFGLGEEVSSANVARVGGLRQAHHQHLARLAGSESRYMALFRALQRHPEQIYTDELEIHGPEEQDAAAGRAGSRIYLRRGLAISGALGERRGLMVIYKEVTSIKSIERAKDEFVAGVTHELRSPLSAIKGFAETMRRDEKMPDATRQEFVGIICEETERLQNMIEEVLDLRRLEASGVALNAASYNLRALVKEVASGARSMLLAKGIKLRLEWSNEPDCGLSGDPGQISRAIRNLIVNAIKYSPQGGEILLRGHCGPKAAWIEVGDQGVGISEADLPHIFDKFYRGKSKGGQKGTGLGLAIVKHIVELHGGHLGVRSEVDRGTTFHMELPRQFRPPSQALLGAEDSNSGIEISDLAGSTSGISQSNISQSSSKA